MKSNRGEIGQFAGTIGLAMLIAGWIRYSIQNEFSLATKVILIAGGVLVLAGIVLGFQGIIHFFSKRSSQLGTNTTILVLAVIGILVAINFVGERHHKRFDLTTEKLFTLSDQTRKIVGGLQTDVTVIRFSKEPDAALDDLLGEYKNLSSHFKFENVDLEEKPDVAQQYGATRLGDVIVASGPRKDHLEPSAAGSFQEQDITSAILKVTRNHLKTVCFVTGHGEKSLADEGPEGYSLVDQGLKKEDYITKTINLVSDNGVSPGCDVVVIAGPTQSFFAQESGMISKYLDGAGKALIEIDPDKNPKLDDIFQAWNIQVGDNLVIDASGMGRLLGAGPTIPLVVDYGDSPITKNLQRRMTFFPLARTVSIADKSKTETQSVELLKTSSRSFTKPKLDAKQKTVSYDPKTDTIGPLSLGVAADWKKDGKSARLVVIGDSDFASNQAIGAAGSNGDLFFNTIDWLAQDENLISIRPKSVTNRRITLTEAQAMGLKWLDMFFLPGIVILAGIVIWWKRR